jgi:DNA-binding NarL/FixJ family response regulator
MIRVFLVDDHAIMRDGLRSVLATEPLLQVVGEAANGQELLGQLPAVPVDVVVLDMNMPVLDGLATTRELQQQYPRLRVLMLSMLTNEYTIAEVLAAGAHGYVLKNADKSEIVTAIRAVAAGKRFLCSDIGLSLLEKFTALPEVEAGASTRLPAGLSHREREILQLVAEGLTNQQIADKLFTSRRTVESHRQSLLEKTGAKNTPALVRYAMEQGLLKSAS